MRAKRVNRIRIYRDFSLVAERQREFALAWVETTSEKTLRLGRLRLPFSRFGKRNERATGIEPALPAWKAGTLPLSYARIGQ